MAIDPRTMQLILDENRMVLTAQTDFRARIRALLLQDTPGSQFGAALNTALLDLLHTLRASRDHLRSFES